MPFAVLIGPITPILPQYNIYLGPLYNKILRPSLNTKWSTVQSCCPFRRKTENYWRNSLTTIWNSISFIEFNQKSIQNDGSTLLGRPRNLLVAKLRVNLRGSSNRLWSNLIAIRVDTQLKNGFGVQLLFRQRVLKTTELQEQYKKHVTDRYPWVIYICLTLAVLIPSYVIIMSKFIRKAHVQQLGSVMSAERKLSVTLFIVSAASTLTLLPWVIIMCIAISSDRYLWIKFTPMKIASTFYHFNSILNPVIYAIRLTEFRRASKELFCKNNSYPVRQVQPIELQAM